jgi:hypothetical protein
MINPKLLLFLITLFTFSIYSQESSETDSSVPALYDFHEIIYPIWHTAYPGKDYSMLKKMVPEVNSGAEKIYSAELPGILRDEKNEWDEGVTKFKSSVEMYSKSMDGGSEEEMLKAAEQLHSDFEMLVRIIRPVTKEVDEFHKVLYMIYHHYWPDRDMIQFKDAVDDLDELAAELNKCVLPKWAADKSDAFMEQSQKLYESTQSLKALKDSNDDNLEIDKAIEYVHSNYVALESLFDK